MSYKIAGIGLAVILAPTITILLKLNISDAFGIGVILGFSLTIVGDWLDRRRGN